LVTKDRECIFGDILGDVFMSTPAGIIILEEWLRTPE
jgi:hypothetical protein